jgi:hypothetical protein
MENGRETGRKNILNNLRRDDLTRTTPCRKGVEDNDGVVLERVGELFFAVQSTTLASISIHLQTRCTNQRETYLVTLWTPILLAVLLNPLAGMLMPIEFLFAYVFVVRRIARVLVVDLKKNDINFRSAPSVLLIAAWWLKEEDLRRAVNGIVDF